jgi:hypothetical protein
MLPIENTPRRDWVTGTANAFQVLVGALSGYATVEAAHDLFEHITEPRDHTEKLFFRYLTCALLLKRRRFEIPVARQHTFESIVDAWDSIHWHAQPVTVLRRILNPTRAAAFAPTLVLAERVLHLLERQGVRQTREGVGVASTRVTFVGRIPNLGLLRVFAGR